VGIAPVRALLHNRVAWLKRRQRVRRGRRSLVLVVMGVVRVLLLLLLVGEMRRWC
jgi:Tfp pilus assembly protein PilN